MNIDEDELWQEYEEYMKEQQEEIELRKQVFYSKVKAEIFKDIQKDQEDAYNQWLYISGRKNRYSDGTKIRLNKHSLRVLSKQFEYYSTTEGIEKLQNLSIEAPENEDDICGWISNVGSSRDLSNRVFKFILKKYRNFLKN